jgi:hypothetical protein
VPRKNSIPPSSSKVTTFTFYIQNVDTDFLELGQMTADIGLIGLAVMGENLILNMESKGELYA